MKVFATYNIKGGVGKTATAVNLAYLAARDGYRVLLWDLDPQAAASFLFRIKPRVKGGGKALIQGTRLDRRRDQGHRLRQPGPAAGRLHLPQPGPASWTAPRTRPAGCAACWRRCARDYDIIFLDCPPSISLLSESVLHAADVLLVPLIPTTLSVRTLDQLTEFIAGFDGHRPAVLAFFSMIDRRKRLHLEIADELPAQRSDFAATAIPALSVIERMSVQRAPVTAFAPRSAAARSYAALWAEARARSALPAPLAWRSAETGQETDHRLVHLVRPFLLGPVPAAGQQHRLGQPGHEVAQLRQHCLAAGKPDHQVAVTGQVEQRGP